MEYKENLQKLTIHGTTLQKQASFKVFLEAGLWLLRTALSGKLTINSLYEKIELYYSIRTDFFQIIFGRFFVLFDDISSKCNRSHVKVFKSKVGYE